MRSLYRKTNPVFSFLVQPSEQKEDLLGGGAEDNKINCRSQWHEQPSVIPEPMCTADDKTKETKAGVTGGAQETRKCC